MLKQLSGLDSMFLYAENSRMPLEVSSLHIYDPSTSPRGKVRFKEVLATFDNRLEDAGIFHRKVMHLPLSIDHPYWVEDENFDIEYHVRHIALPRPGDWRQLMIQVSRLQSRELDKTRPLWEAYVIEGLDNVKGLKKGCFAVFMKMHHSTIDGVSGAALQAAIHDLDPVQPSATEYKPSIRSSGDATPDMSNLLLRSVINNVNKTAKLAYSIGSAIPRLIKANTEVKQVKHAVPSTVFNRGRVTPNRVIDGRLFDLGEIKAIAKASPGAKVNDAALAIVSGALRKYLLAKGDLPEQSLIAACPLNVRTAESDGHDNMVSMMSTALRTDIDDPAQRLNAIVESTRKAKEYTEVLGANTLTLIPMHLPAFVASGIMGPLLNLAVRFDAVSYNTMVSNVAGIQQPLYFCGAEMVAMYGMGPVVDQSGLFHAIFSYNGKVTFTFTACRDMLPDPDVYAQCIQDSFDELKAALIKPAKKPKKKTARKKRAKTNGAAAKPVTKKPARGKEDVGRTTA